MSRWSWNVDPNRENCRCAGCNKSFRYDTSSYPIKYDSKDWHENCLLDMLTEYHSGNTKQELNWSGLS